MIDYAHICRVASRWARRLPPSIDWRDLAQEVALRQLRGRKSIEGPMLDYLRRQGILGPQKGTRISVYEIEEARHATTGPVREFLLAGARRRLIGLPARYRAILGMLYVDELSPEEVAQRCAVTPDRVHKIRVAAFRRIRGSSPKCSRVALQRLVASRKEGGA